MAQAQDRHGIGGNNPPSQLEILKDKYGMLATGVDQLAAEADKAPKSVKSERDLDAVGVIVKDAKLMLKRLETDRKKEKEPFDEGAKQVQTFFKAYMERVERIAKTLEDRATVFVQEKAAEERRRREEEARKLREKEEAERRKAEEAAAAGRTTAAARAEDRAELAAQRADEAAAAAAASAADLTRSRGESGTLAGARSRLDVRIVNFDVVDLNKLRPYLDRELVLKGARAWLRVTKGTEEIDGLQVFEDTRATFR